MKFKGFLGHRSRLKTLRDDEDPSRAVALEIKDLQGRLAEANLWHNTKRSAKKLKARVNDARRTSLTGDAGLVAAQRAIKLRRRDAAYADSDEEAHDLTHNALAHAARHPSQLPGLAGRRRSRIDLAALHPGLVAGLSGAQSAPALGLAALQV